MSTTLMKYHPRAGYTYMPEARLRMTSQRGGYLVRANTAGFRSEREFVRERTPGVFRALLFGDSQTAADGVSNSGRYSDLLEKSVPGLEVYNYAISGQGPDQQLLLFEEQAETERDLVVVGLYIENIRRIGSRLAKSRSASGEMQYRAKPYYELENDALVLHNVPVSKDAWTDETLPAEYREHVYAHGEADRVVDYVKAKLRTAPFVAPLGRAVKSAAMRFNKRLQPVPEYNTPDDPSWRVLRKVLESFVEKRTPVLIVLIPHYFFLAEGSDPSAYQARFRELAEASGCHVYDLLPDLLRSTPQERSTLWSDAEGHLSAAGHQRLAELIGPHIRRFMQQREPRAAETHIHADAK